MVVWYPEDVRWWRPWPSRHVPVIVVILVLVVGIGCAVGQLAAMASLFAAITAAITPQPRWVVSV
jgi:hypothetical protein